MIVHFHNTVAYPSRKNVQDHYIVKHGESVTLRSGVGEGALAAHYSPQWFKGFLPLRDSNISRGKDFSLHIEAVQVSDDGMYFSRVIIFNDNGLAQHVVEENKNPIVLTVFGEFLLVHTSLISICTVAQFKKLFFRQTFNMVTELCHSLVATMHAKTMQQIFTRKLSNKRSDEP